MDWLELVDTDAVPPHHHSRSGPAKPAMSRGAVAAALLDPQSTDVAQSTVGLVQDPTSFFVRGPSLRAAGSASAFLSDVAAVSHSPETHWDFLAARPAPTRVATAF